MKTFNEYVAETTAPIIMDAVRISCSLDMMTVLG